jgi:hypothetical protein
VGVGIEGLLGSGFEDLGFLLVWSILCILPVYLGAPYVFIINFYLSKKEKKSLYSGRVLA